MNETKKNRRTNQERLLNRIIAINDRRRKIIMNPDRWIFSANRVMRRWKKWTYGILDRSQDSFRFHKILHTLLALLLYVLLAQCGRFYDLCRANEIIVGNLFASSVNSRRWEARLEHKANVGDMTWENGAQYLRVRVASWRACLDLNLTARRRERTWPEYASRMCHKKVTFIGILYQLRVNRWRSDDDKIWLWCRKNEMHRYKMSYLTACRGNSATKLTASLYKRNILKKVFEF